MRTATPTTASNPHQPGKSWVVVEDNDGSFNITLPLGFGKKKMANILLDPEFCRADSSVGCDCHQLWDEELVQEERYYPG